MAARITLAEAQAWLEPTKLSLSQLDLAVEEQITSVVLGRLSAAYAAVVPLWIAPASTPAIVRSIIAMNYAGWVYDRQYSENPDQNSYADRLRASAEQLLVGLIDGSIDIVEVPTSSSNNEPSFYPTDASSAACPTPEDPSLGPARFSMGKVF